MSEAADRDTRTESTITVMSYNVCYANPNDGDYVWERRRDGVADVIAAHDPDLIGLQEANPGQVADLRERLPSYRWLPAGREHGDAGEFVAIGFDPETFELVADGTFWLSENPAEPGTCGWDAELPRLIRHVRLRHREFDTAISHFNTHFDHDGEVARRQSARLLRERIENVAPDVPVVVTGDFNSRRSTDVYRYLTAPTDDGPILVDAHDSAARPHRGPETTMTDFHDLVPDKKIDYVFTSRDVEVGAHGVVSTTPLEMYPSDHLPVLARLSLPEPA